MCLYWRTVNTRPQCWAQSTIAMVGGLVGRQVRHLSSGTVSSARLEISGRTAGSATHLLTPLTSKFPVTTYVRRSVLCMRPCACCASPFHLFGPQHVVVCKLVLITSSCLRVRGSLRSVRVAGLACGAISALALALRSPPQHTDHSHGPCHQTQVPRPAEGCSGSTSTRVHCTLVVGVQCCQLIWPSSAHGWTGS
jgi:hypothetical protein